jgi:hypothetical protein
MEQQASASKMNADNVSAPVGTYPDMHQPSHRPANDSNSAKTFDADGNIAINMDGGNGF